MTTPARPGVFTGATDVASSGGYFGTTLLSGIPDLIATDVATANSAATTATNAITTTGANVTAAANSAADALKLATNPVDQSFYLADGSGPYYSALHYVSEGVQSTKGFAIAMAVAL